MDNTTVILWEIMRCHEGHNVKIVRHNHGQKFCLECEDCKETLIQVSDGKVHEGMRMF